MYEPKKIVARIQAAAKSKGVSIRSMQEKLGFGVNYIEQAKAKNMSCIKLAMIADELGVTTDFLLSREVPAQNPYGLPSAELEILDRIQAMPPENRERLLKTIEKMIPMYDK